MSNEAKSSGRIVRELVTPAQRQHRMNVRNFLMVATPEELRKELDISEERGESFRAACIRELMEE